MTVRVRFTEFVKDSEDLENSNLFVFVHIKFEMFEFVLEGKIRQMTPLDPILKPPLTQKLHTKLT